MRMFQKLINHQQWVQSQPQPQPQPTIHLRVPILIDLQAWLYTIDAKICLGFQKLNYWIYNILISKPSWTW